MNVYEGYPTLQHEKATKGIVEFFSNSESVDAILLFCSCARGKATADSCLDIAVLLREDVDEADRRTIEIAWNAFEGNSPEIVELRTVGKYSQVHLDFINGLFIPKDQEFGGAQDSLELEIGNYLAYSVPLWQNGKHLQELKSKWLPYYPEDLQKHRLHMVRSNCLNNVHHIPLYTKRGLYFQCFDRLYSAYKELLQAIFIACHAYPIAYNKWIREQIEEILGLPQLYEKISHLFEIRSFESEAIKNKAEFVEELLERYA